MMQRFLVFLGVLSSGLFIAALLQKKSEVDPERAALKREIAELLAWAQMSD